MQKNKNYLIYLIIFFSGFSFLIYEVSWNRFLALILGATVTASTLVLIAIMSGFGIGALLLGKKANNTNNSGVFLAKLLLVIGILSFTNYFLIGKYLKFVYNIFENYVLADLLFYITTSILLFIPAFFMGGVLPIANKILISNNENIGKKIGTLYAFETLGSTLGGLITGFVLLGLIGQKATMFVSVILYLLLSLIIYIFKLFNEHKVIEKQNVTKFLNIQNSKKSQKIALIATFFIGLVILSLQIIWNRIFKTYFTNTSYTFTLITSMSILGISIGSWIYQKNNTKIKSNDFGVVISLFLIIILSSLGLFLLFKLPEVIMFPLKEFGEVPFYRLIIIPLISSLLIVLPPSIISGFAFPLVCNMYSESIENIGKNIGKILMFNTIGTALGPAITTFILIPTIGVGKSALVFLAVLFIVLYIILRNINTENNKIYKFTSLSFSIFIILIIILGKEIRFLPPSIKIIKPEIITYKETTEGTIILTNEQSKGIFGYSTYINNSTVIGSNFDAIKAVKMVGHIPFLIGLDCENVLVIGFGIGVTTSAIASHSEVKRIDCVELVPGLVESAKYYKDFNNEVYKDSRLNIISGDGRHFLQITKNKYDLISCDPTHPVLGSGNLYTKDYFEQLNEHLTENGMMSQYLPLHKLKLTDLLGIIKTFYEVFPNSYVWLGQYHAILIGKKDENKIDFKTWQKQVSLVKNDMFLYLDAYHIASSVVFDKNIVDNFQKDLKINTDNLNYTEFFSFSSLDENNIYINLDFFANNRCDVYKVFKNIQNKYLMDKYIAGNKKLVESIYFSLKGEHKKALESLSKAIELNPENQEYSFLMKLNYGF